MMKYFVVIFLLAAMAISLCSQSMAQQVATKGSPGFRTESRAHIREEKDTVSYVTENSSFHFAEVVGDQGTYEFVLLLEEHYRNENTPGIEGARGDATIKAWTMKGLEKRALRWTVHQKANAGELQGRFFRLTTWGCCDAPIAYTYYNLLSGKKLYVTNFNLIEVRGKGEGPLAGRYIGFGYDTLGSGHDPILQYGTDRNVAQRISVHSGKDYYDMPEVFATAKDRTEKIQLLLGDSPLTFVIVLRYSVDAELRIPVENDVVKPEKATLPKGYSIRQDN